MAKNTLSLNDAILAAVAKSPKLQPILMKAFKRKVEKRRLAYEIAYKQLVHGILAHIKNGVIGPTSRGGSATIRIGRESVKVRWPGLSKDYRKRKERYDTSGTFWKYTGGLASRLPGVDPTVTAEIQERKRGGVQVLEKRGRSVMFRVGAVLKFSSLPFPLNDLVRTPFLTGETPEFEKYAERSGFGGLSLVLALEGGTEKAAARPFIVELSTKLGRTMRAKAF